ncbi:ribbon-helix-helix domain-containing protein [Staphylococcus coagulans]|uniref:ribbon-helix-helix domain-containing protein n=1 Tax=Staphylococcus coagulans TaxID=74706 RepID=UPI001F4BE10D|nr:ribbon-helix-helix domain-containing protein [Staphylococcus coagulans]UNB46771.1 ribbon-helix-helix domain-containing protein [Staphylococcus coagulans]
MAKTNKTIYLESELLEKVDFLLNSNIQFSSISKLISHLLEEYLNNNHNKKYHETKLEKDILEMKQKLSLAEIVLFNMANSQILDVTKNYPDETTQYKFAKKMLEERYNQSKMTPYKNYGTVDINEQNENKFSADINYFDR